MLWSQIHMPLLLVRDRIKKHVKYGIIIFFTAFFKLFPLTKSIVFECESDMDDNPRAFYEYLLGVHWNEKHIIVWIVKDVELCKKLYSQDNVVFISRFSKDIKTRIKLEYYLSTAKFFVFSHPYWFKKRKKGQLIVNVWHGTPIKAAPAPNKKFLESFDFIIVPSETSKDIYFLGLNCPKEKMRVCGAPRLDLFRRNSKEAVFSQLFEYYPGEKVVICLPTYKQSRVEKDSIAEDTFSLNVISTFDEYNALNQFLSERNMHLIIKPHPLQLKDNLWMKDASNIHYIQNSQLLKRKVIFYELLGNCDALLTDLSSVYYDFLLVDRPIGLLTKTIDQYQRGMIDRDSFDQLPGERIDSLDSLFSFLERVDKGINAFSKEMEHLSLRFNQIQDGLYSEELADLIFNNKAFCSQGLDSNSCYCE